MIYSETEQLKQNVLFSQCSIDRAPAKTQPVIDAYNTWDMQMPTIIEHAKKNPHTEMKKTGPHHMHKNYDKKYE